MLEYKGRQTVSNAQKICRQGWSTLTGTGRDQKIGMADFVTNLSHLVCVLTFVDFCLLRADRDCNMFKYTNEKLFFFSGKRNPFSSTESQKNFKAVKNLT